MHLRKEQKSICAAFVKSSWVPYYISPSGIDVGLSLFKVTLKHLTGFEVQELRLHCEVDCNCIAEQLIELQSRQLWSLWLNSEVMSSQWNQMSLVCVGRQQTLLLFPTTYRYVAFFQHYNYFKHWNPLQPKDNIRCRFQRLSDSGFLLSDPILFLKNHIRIRSESWFGWNHTIRIRKLSESVLRCIT